MIWKNARLPRSKPSSVREKTAYSARTRLDKARAMARSLLEDKCLPSSARARLGEDCHQLERLLDKLEKGYFHVAVFARVGVGNSALLNALAGREAFAISVPIGTVYGVQFLSFLLKAGTVGLSTVFTASAQAGVAFYGSYVVDKAAERYFTAGASWVESGAKRVIEEIIADLDKDALIREANASIRQIREKKHER